MLRLQILEENELILSDCRWGGLVNVHRPSQGEALSLDAMAVERVQGSWARVNFSSKSPSPESRPQVQKGFCQRYHHGKDVSWSHTGGLDPRTITQKETPRNQDTFQSYISEEDFSLPYFCTSCLSIQTALPSPITPENSHTSFKKQLKCSFCSLC